MEKKLIKKMIFNCFKQYYETETIPLSEEDLEKLMTSILQVIEGEPDTDLYEVINDKVYEFLSN